MDTLLTSIFETKIKATTSFDFEDLVKEIFLIKYGNINFTPTRPKRDKGCDGIINDTKTIVACYGPDSYDYHKFKDKAKDDYGEYKKHWKKNFPEWMMVVNHKLSPDEVKEIKRLKGSIIGLDNLINIIKTDFNNLQRRQLGNYLNIDERFFVQDYIKDILEDLLKSHSNDNKDIDYNPKDLTAISRKIELNYEKDDIDAAKKEYETVYLDFVLVESLISNYSDGEKNIIKSNIITDYKNRNGNFKNRLQSLIELYSHKYSNGNSDDHIYYIKVILLYHFEQCLIGIKE